MEQNTRRMDDPSNYHIDPNTLDPRDAALLYNVPCPKCGGIRIKACASAAGAGSIIVYQPADSKWLPKIRLAYCRSLVCLDCGYTELFTLDPRNLLRRPE